MQPSCVLNTWSLAYLQREAVNASPRNLPKPDAPNDRVDLRRGPGRRACVRRRAPHRRRRHRAERAGRDRLRPRLGEPRRSRSCTRTAPRSTGSHRVEALRPAGFGTFGPSVAHRRPCSTRWDDDGASGMAHRILILGGGTGGTLGREPAAPPLRARRGADHRRRPGRRARVPARPALRAVRARARRRHRAAALPPTRLDRSTSSSHAIDHVDIDANQVLLANGTTLDYDVLVVATGAVLVPEETEGLLGAGLEQERVHLLRPRWRAGALPTRSPPSKAAGSS